MSKSTKNFLIYDYMIIRMPNWISDMKETIKFSDYYTSYRCMSSKACKGLYLGVSHKGVQYFL